jgi:hypothetical protein
VITGKAVEAAAGLPSSLLWKPAAVMSRAYLVEPMVHRQLFNAFVELALQIVFLFLQFLLFLPQSLQLVLTLRNFADVPLDELFLLLGFAQSAQVFAHTLLISGDRVYLALLLGDLARERPLIG